MTVRQRVFEVPAGSLEAATNPAVPRLNDCTAIAWPRLYGHHMRAQDMAEEFPVITVDSDALEAVRTLAQQRLPGILVVDAAGKQYAVLPASQVVRFIVPRYVQDDPPLAGVIHESMADRIAERLHGKTVRDMLPDHLIDVPPANFDDTIIEVAEKMARLRSPLIAVTKDGRLQGVITASRLLAAVLKS